MVSTDISLQGSNTSCQTGAPGSLIEEEAVPTVIVAVNAPVHTSATGGVIVVVVVVVVTRLAQLPLVLEMIVTVFGSMALEGLVMPVS